MKLRLPEDYLINGLTNRTEELLLDMTPKDLAVTVWSLARLDYPASDELKETIENAIEAVLNQLNESPALFQSEKDPQESNLIDDEITP